MAWQFVGSAPIYTQLTEHIKMGIISGEFPAGGKLPGVRELAAEAGVNPNTMQRAFLELERDGLVYSQRTSGRYVTEDAYRIEDMRRSLAEEHIRKFSKTMELLGYSQGDIIKLVTEELGEE